MFRDRTEAGRRLAERLQHLRDRDPVVLALPRGGVPVGFEIASALGCPLDVVLVRKIGAPHQPELALGAVVDGEQAETVINEDVAASVGASEDYIEQATRRELEEIERRRQLYRGERPRAEVAGRTAIVVDDGIATGATMRAALIAIRRAGPAHLVLAAPVAPPDTIEKLAREVDEVVCLATPWLFFAIGRFYDDFHQVSDQEVIDLLERAQAWVGSTAPDA